MGLHEVSITLWQERNLLELLLFKLEEERQFAGNLRWADLAAHEVEVVLERIREAETMRSVEVDQVAPALRLTPGPSLKQLAEHAPTPWDTEFHDHRLVLLQLTDEIISLPAADREVVARGQRAAQDFLANFVDPASTSGYPMDTQRERTPSVLDRAS